MTQGLGRYVFGRYMVVTALVIALAGGLFSLVFHGPGDGAAIGISGAVALVVQLVAFMLSRLVGRTTNNLMARMGTGALVRMFALFGLALLLGARVVTLPLAATLVSFAAFLFLASLVEPLLIK